MKNHPMRLYHKVAAMNHSFNRKRSMIVANHAPGPIADAAKRNADVEAVKENFHRAKYEQYSK